MATDNTPPRLRLIATIAVIVVITLVGLDFVLKGYYAYMSDEAVREKQAPRTALLEQLTAEHAAFAQAKMPIDKAAAELKSSRPEIIEPKQSEDMAPMTGWAKMPKQAPLPAPAPMHGSTPGHDAPDMAAGDAGVHGAADGGAMAPHAGAEAGAPAPKPARDAGARAPH